MPLPMRRNWRRCSAGGEQGTGVPRRAPRAFPFNMLSDSRPIRHKDRPRGSPESGEGQLPCGTPLRGGIRNGALRTLRRNIASLQAARRQPPAVRVLAVKLLAAGAAGPVWLEIRPRSGMPAILFGGPSRARGGLDPRLRSHSRLSLADAMLLFGPLDQPRIYRSRRRIDDRPIGPSSVRYLTTGKPRRSRPLLARQDTAAGPLGGRRSDSPTMSCGTSRMWRAGLGADHEALDRTCVERLT